MNTNNPVVVITNDDGIDAPGILAMERAVRAIGIENYHVIAPVGPCSGCGHRVTTHEPIRFNAIDERHTSIAGMPADCVRLAIHHLAPSVTLILSGINAGGNLGTDLFHSGTLAAVREGGLYGIPGIGISHYIARGRTIDWDWAAAQAGRVIRELSAAPWAPGTFWNVNLPHPVSSDTVPEIIHCPVDPSPLPLNYRVEDSQAYYAGDYQARERLAGRDVAVCFGGSVAISSIRLMDPGPGAEYEGRALRPLADFLRGIHGNIAGFRLADRHSATP